MVLHRTRNPWSSAAPAWGFDSPALLCVSVAELAQAGACKASDVGSSPTRDSWRAGRVARHQVATLRSSETAQGFDSSALRNCVGRSSTVERRTVAPVMAVRLRSVKTEGVRQDEEHDLKSCSGVTSVVGSSPTPSSVRVRGVNGSTPGSRPGNLGSNPSGPASCVRGPTAEARGLSPRGSGFESWRTHMRSWANWQSRPPQKGVDGGSNPPGRTCASRPTGRVAGLRGRMFRVRLPARAHGQVAQMVEHRVEVPGVGGSIPSLSTHARVGQLAESPVSEAGCWWFESTHGHKTSWVGSLIGEGTRL